MSIVYQPLHHKYRPQSFEALVGQEVIAATLTQALKTSRIAPAYLFTGPRGTGKTSSARILARSLNCLSSEAPTPLPCGECSLCQNISSGTALDVIEIDAASNTGVDNIRELIERSRFAPVQARWKVYVIDECHMLSTAAFNALLKTLEEPPRQVVFVLATTDPQRVLPTIISRCQRFDFRRIPLDSLEAHLTMIASREEIDIQKDAIHLISQRSQGGLRDAESMLDQLSLLPGPIKVEMVWDLLGAVPENELLNLVSALAKDDPLLLLQSARFLLDEGRDSMAVLQGLTAVLRDLVLICVAPNRPELASISLNLYQELIPLSKDIGIKKLLEWQSILKNSESQLRNSLQPRLWLEVLLLGLLSSAEDISGASTKRLIPAKNLPIEDSLLSTRKKDNPPSVQNKSMGNDVLINNKQLKSNASIKNTSKEQINLAELWQQILGSLELPSTRMLLSQQAKLIELSNEIAVIEVAGNWTTMVQSRLGLIEKAIIKVIGSSRRITIKDYIDQPKDYANTNLKNNEAKDPDNKSLDQIISNNSQKDINQEFNNKIKKPEQDNPPQDKLLLQDQIEGKAEVLADFFNGKVLDIDL